MKFLNTIIILLFCLSFVYADSNENQERNQNAIQKIYLNGVPHIDKNGNTLMKYDKNKSFFQIASWGTAIPGEKYGKTYDWKVLKDAGINTVWPWPEISSLDRLKLAKKYGFQAVLLTPIPEKEMAGINNHPNLIGNCWLDEPIAHWPNMESLFKDYQNYIALAKKNAPDLKVFVNDAPGILGDAGAWWIKWNSETSISCHDNYPVLADVDSGRTDTLSLGAAKGANGIDKTVSLAREMNNEKKPVWCIVGTFEGSHEYKQDFGFRFPTPNQLRSCVYTAINHGATSIIYFIWDSYVAREGGLVGMSPNPEAKITNNESNFVATPEQLVNSKANWEMMSQINKEIKELTPSILSPTSTDLDYSVNITGKSPTNNPISCLLKPDLKGGHILLTNNQDNAWLNVEYTFDKSVKSVEIMFENKKPLKLSDKNSVTINYEPFEAHIIKIN